MYHAYSNAIKMEANCLLDMLKTGVLPAALADLKHTKDALGDVAAKVVAQHVALKQAKVTELIECTQALEAVLVAFPAGHDGDAAAATYCLERLKPAMEVCTWGI